MKLKIGKTYWIKHNAPLYTYVGGIEREFIEERATIATVESHKNNEYELRIIGWDGKDRLPDKYLLDAVEILCPWDNIRID